MEGLMKFEYDNAKSFTNSKEHGISFEESKNLWEDVNPTTMIRV